MQGTKCIPQLFYDPVNDKFQNKAYIKRYFLKNLPSIIYYLCFIFNFKLQPDYLFTLDKSSIQ